MRIEERAHNGSLIQVVADWTATEANEQTIRDQAATALTANTAYVALVTPTAAQNTAQLKALSRQNNKVIRLLIGRLEGTD